MATATPPIDLHEHAPNVEIKSQRRRSSLNESNDLDSLHESSKHLQALRRNHSEDDDDGDSDSDSSTNSASSQDSSGQHTKEKRSKQSRAVNSKGSRSSLSSNGDSYMPTLGSILEGRASREDSTKASAPPVSHRIKSRSHTKHAGRSGRTTRHHRSQGEQDTSNKSLVSPSLQSVLSSLTSTTNSSSGSNGSGSTITKSSYAKSEASKRSGLSSVDPVTSGHNGHKRRRRRRAHKEQEGLDVFAFLEDDGTDTDDTASQSGSEAGEESALRPQTPPMQAHRSSADPFESPKPMRVASWASQDHDSGISVRGSSPESVGRRHSDKQLATTQGDGDAKAKVDGAIAPSREQTETTASWQRRWSTASTGPTHPPSYVHHQGYPPMSVIPYTQSPPAYPGQNTDRGLIAAHQQPKPSGYDLIASRLSDTCPSEDRKVAPLYRRFDHLNHRILLHLQDEIAEMEEQLQSLEATLAKCKSSPPSPESRRAEARYATDLTYQRTELLGRVFIKIKQYNDAVVSYHTVTKQTPAARAEEIERYRGFTKNSKPITSEELRFLDHPQDLVDLSSPAPDTASVVPSRISRPITTMPSLLLGPPAAMLVAFVMFSAASSWLVRAFLLVLFSGAGYIGIYLTGLGRDMMADQERQVCLGFYVCLLACIAATAG